MSTTASSTGYGASAERRKSPAELVCLVLGPTLILAGLLGFFADATFDTTANPGTNAAQQAGELNGDSFLGFEVNGWHNVVHILSGLFLLALARKAKTARLALLLFGGIYALVTIIGLIDGNDVLGFIPINPADNVLHALFTLVALGAALATKVDRDGNSGHLAGGGRTDEGARERGSIPTSTRSSHSGSGNIGARRA